MDTRYIIIAGTNGAGKTTLYETNPKLFQMSQQGTFLFWEQSGRKEPQNICGVLQSTG